MEEGPLYILIIFQSRVIKRARVSIFLDFCSRSCGCPYGGGDSVGGCVASQLPRAIYIFWIKKSMRAPKNAHTTSAITHGATSALKMYYFNDFATSSCSPPQAASSKVIGSVVVTLIISICTQDQPLKAYEIFCIFSQYGSGNGVGRLTLFTHSSFEKERYF